MSPVESVVVSCLSASDGVDPVARVNQSSPVVSAISAPVESSTDLSASHIDGDLARVVTSSPHLFARSSAN